MFAGIDALPGVTSIASSVRSLRVRRSKLAVQLFRTNCSCPSARGEATTSAVSDTRRTAPNRSAGIADETWLDNVRAPRSDKDGGRLWSDQRRSCDFIQRGRSEIVTLLSAVADRTPENCPSSRMCGRVRVARSRRQIYLIVDENMSLVIESRTRRRGADEVYMSADRVWNYRPISICTDSITTTAPRKSLVSLGSSSVGRRVLET